MKNFKKLMALLIAAAMIMGSTSLGVFAEDAPYDSQLVISGLEKGDIVHFYQVLGWEKAGTNPAVLPDSVTGNSIGGWIYTSTFITMSSTGETPVNMITGSGEGGITSDIAGKLARMAQSGEITSIDVATRTAGDDGKVTVTPPAAGLYMALITPADPDIVYNPVFVSADYNPTDGTQSKAIAISVAEYSNDGAAKKSKLEIKKSASTVETAPDDVKSGTVAIGDEVTFTVNTTIPGFGTVYENPVYVMRDKLTDLKLIKTSQMTIKIAGSEVPTSRYTLSGVSDNSTEYSISFKSDYLKTLTTPQQLEVVYKALVTTEAASNVNTETNEVDIKYSHNPNDTTGFDLKAQKDTTQHYTFTIDANAIYNYKNRIGESTTELVKVGLESDEKTPVYSTIKTSSNITEGKEVVSPLEGAHFKLYRNPECTVEYVPKDEDGNEIAVLDIKSDAAGRLNIPGLDAGTYYLKEVQAPAGFIADTKVVPIVIDATIREKEVTEYYKVNPADGSVDWKDKETAGYTAFTYKTEVLEKVTITVDGKQASSHTFMNTSESGNDIVWKSSDPATSENPQPLLNKRGVELPSTGGIGTTIFYMGGAVLVLLAGVLLVSKRRIA